MSHYSLAACPGLTQPRSARAGSGRYTPAAGDPLSSPGLFPGPAAQGFTPAYSLPQWNSQFLNKEGQKDERSSGALLEIQRARWLLLTFRGPTACEQGFPAQLPQGTALLSACSDNCCCKYQQSTKSPPPLATPTRKHGQERIYSKQACLVALFLRPWQNEGVLPSPLRYWSNWTFSGLCHCGWKPPPIFGEMSSPSICVKVVQLFPDCERCSRKRGKPGTAQLPWKQDKKYFRGKKQAFLSLICMEHILYTCICFSLNFAFLYFTTFFKSMYYIYHLKTLE